ncbi:MAG: hypothetical protein ACRDYV_05765, partial [Acidimicrobiia bacterium]
MPEDLPDKEGVPFRLVVNGPGQGQALFLELMARRLLHEGSHPGGVEPGERDALHAPLTTQVGEHLDQRMVVAEFGVPVSAQDEDPLGLGRAYDVAQQQQGGLRRPVEVVEDEQDGRLGRDGGEPGGHGVEQAVT